MEGNVKSAGSVIVQVSVVAEFLKEAPDLIFSGSFNFVSPPFFEALQSDYSLVRSKLRKDLIFEFELASDLGFSDNI